jgi:hypothetical protein
MTFLKRKNTAGFSYKKPKVLLKKPAGSTCVKP